MATKKAPAKKAATKVKAGTSKKAATPKKRGRPSGYTQEIGDSICDRLANGESLRYICSGDGMPSQSMVFRWLASNEMFREQYTRAREAQADVLADETLAIADDGRNDWMERHGKDDAGWQFNGEAVARSRLRVEARKWFASKLLPKKYGDRTTLAGDAENPLAVTLLDQIAANPKSRLVV